MLVQVFEINAPVGSMDTPVWKGIQFSYSPRIGEWIAIHTEEFEQVFEVLAVCYNDNDHGNAVDIYAKRLGSRHQALDALSAQVSADEW